MPNLAGLSVASIFKSYKNLYRMKYDDSAYMCFITHVTAQKPSALVVSKDGKSLVSAKEAKDTNKKK